MKELGIIHGLYKQEGTWIEKIKSYKEITGETRKYYVGEHPCIYEELNNSIYTTDRERLVMADFDKAIGRVGRLLKIPGEYIGLI